ncbi:Stf0 family sulfotransferase [Pseudokordiimonas caeni]|uniref:Stf0 family sulfotransferase n=1 Tax=Pseudokordiimonas caeni TaxID=2997908 RepID=UPI0028117B25|nr:Stf0 family sulfotransferase [Pseudokordiimonas caeni]
MRDRTVVASDGPRQYGVSRFEAQGYRIMTMPPKPRKSIVLCATQRCGSTMICEDMRNAGTLGLPEEHFLPWQSLKPDMNWAPHLEGVYRRGSGENGVFAVKIMANQMATLDACLATMMPAAESDGRAFPYVRSLFSDATWVWLRRDDVVRQAISREMATQTGVNHATGDTEADHFAGNLLQGYKPDYNVQTQFNEHAIAAKVSSITEENLLWQRFFYDWEIQPLSLIYEDNCRDFPGYLHRLAAAAGLDIPADLPERAMVRLSNAINDEWFETYTDRIINRAVDNRR